ncbi:lectin-like [Cucurbita moschata]|uniref:Lectin-like n=1 Tax=Cucurbita moschata TaxID=3662 RepID=A0A6J1EIJ7_CUCMO|nr:lectin-like [Cucurbita moschata]
MDNKEREAREKLGGEVKLGHCLDVILKNADVALHYPSFVKLYDQLVAGILLNKGAIRYIFDKKLNSNWYFIFARALSIAWIEDKRYWKWGSCGGSEVAELIEVSWLDIRGKINESMLSPNAVYEVALHVQLNDRASGWDAPLNIELKKPDGSKIVRQECLSGKPRNQWFEIVVEYKVGNHGCGSSGEIEFAFYEHGGHWKRGLLVKGVRIGAKGCGCS